MKLRNNYARKQFPAANPKQLVEKRKGTDGAWE